MESLVALSYFNQAKRKGICIVDKYNTSNWGSGGSNSPRGTGDQYRGGCPLFPGIKMVNLLNLLLEHCTHEYGQTMYNVLCVYYPRIL